MVRGVNRCQIFCDDGDRGAFCDRLGRAVEDCSAGVLAWVLLPNHAHLVVRSGERPLSALMQRLGTGYAREFNRRTGRCGHLFQGRFKSLRVEDDAYLRVLVRYVHRNPIKAGLVHSLDELERHPWSGHAALMGRTQVPFQEVGPVLEMFGKSVRVARARLRGWMDEDDAAGAAEGDGDLSSWGEATGTEGSPAHGVLLANAPPGGTALVVRGRPFHRDSGVHGRPERISAHLEHLGDEGVRRAERLRWGRDARALARWVCESMAVDAGAVRAGRRSAGVARARAAIAWIGHEELGIPFTRLAPELGVGVAALSKAALRGPQVASEADLSLERWRDAQVD